MTNCNGAAFVESVRPWPPFGGLFGTSRRNRAEFLMPEQKPRQRTITMTARRPIIIDDGEWDMVAVASEKTEESSGHVRVRKHSDGRQLVYGTSQRKDSASRAGGYLLEPDATDADLIAAILNVGREIGAEHLAARCIAELPPERI